MSIVSKEQKPKPHPFYGSSYIRGLDPFHMDAFPPEFQIGMTKGLPRREGWFLLDAYGTEIGFVADGEKV